jgi:DNA (cytosine-5)-methyltransferase 1
MRDRRPGETLTAGSLCSGYGGLDLAVEFAFGARTVWNAEVAAAPARILAARWPDVPNLGDITRINWGQVEPVAILTAGYPCQPFALAGRRKGTSDDRHLWPAVREAIRNLRPSLTILENVAGHRSLGFDRVLGDLAEDGFDARWTSVRASDVGAPHDRERLFVAVTDPSQATPDYCGKERPRWPRLCADGAAGLWGARPSDRASDHRWRWQGEEAVVARWEAVVGRPCPLPLVTGPRGGPVLNARFGEWMQGLPEGWVTDVQGVTREQAIEACGNGVVPQQAVAAIRELTACLLPVMPELA